MVRDLSSRQQEMRRLSPSVTRKEYEHLQWMLHDLRCRQQEMMRLSTSVTRKEYEHLLWILQDLSQRLERMRRNGPDSCPIGRIQYNHLLSVVQRHEDILILLHKEYEPAGGDFLSIVDRLERRFGRSIVVRLTDRSLLAFTLGPLAVVGLCKLTGFKTPKMLLDEKLKKIPERVDVMQRRLDKLEKIPRRVDVLPDEKSTKIPEKVDLLQRRVDKVEEQVSRLLKPAKVVPVSPPVIAAPMSPLHAFARKFMDRVKTNSELLSASRWDP